MSEYEFWDELGNIFNAIVAYQEKTIEFNKRFVNPWLRLGPIFDRENPTSDTVRAYKKAIDIDKDNADNWLALGDVYFKMGSFDDAASVYGKAIELNPNLGWAYANLAMVFATQQKYTDAIRMYIRSLELITDDKDRSMIWNRLGNIYRRTNDYENAVIAFQLADECDADACGVDHIHVGDVATDQSVDVAVASAESASTVGEQVPDPVMESEVIHAGEEIPAEEIVAMDAGQVSDEGESVIVLETEQPMVEVTADDVEQPAMDASAVGESEVVEMTDELLAQIEAIRAETSVDTTMTPILPHVVETFADPNQAVVIVEAADQPEAKNDAVPVMESNAEAGNVTDVESTLVENMEAFAPNLEMTDEAVKEQLQDDAAEIAFVAPESAPVDSELAYDEYLKDAVELIAVPVEVETGSAAPARHGTVVNLKGGLKVEPDTKDAHVWNELGNVYFNTGAYEEAIAAYSKAIELDDRFAWPYSNLALIYVQKEKYADAMALYLRGIELFSTDKDKAITLNRLGNVYRRLNDYDNAIVCYQRADELDPSHATRSLRARFSLLGGLNMEQPSSLAL